MSAELTIQGIRALQAGDRARARALLSAAIRQDPDDEKAWLWLSGAVESDAGRMECLRRVLAINPDHAAARSGLEMLHSKSGAYPGPDDLLSGLTDPQKEAVLHLGSPLLIIAGPGSGKTEVIARRVAYLVRSGIFQPEDVLALTFTDRAAHELKDRIQRKLVQVNAERMQVSTIHSFASLLLRQYSAKSPLPRGFRQLDETGQFLYVYSRRNVLGLGEIVKGRPQDFFAAVLRVFNLATEELVAPEKLADWCDEQLAQASGKEIDLCKEREIIAEAYRRYCELLQEDALIDFAFLQRHALSLLKNNPDILRELRGKYAAILVDEYQDTNAAQERIIAHLAGDGRNLTVVGDDDQSIYRFRGATVTNILTFKDRYVNVHEVILPHNFRSREQIVDHSLQVINHNPMRFPKDLQATRGLGSDVLLVYEHSATEEARSVINLIRRLYDAGRIKQFGDVVILLRSVKSYAGSYIEALSAQGIPYQVIGDASLFERQEIAQIYDLFNFLGTTKAWGDKYLRDPIVGLSEGACKVLKGYKDSLYDLFGEDRTACDQALENIGVEEGRDRTCLLRLLGLKRKVQAQEHQSILEIFYDLLAATGCVGRYEQSGNFTAISNLGILSHLIANWDECGSTRNFYPFREYLKLVKDSGVDPALPPAEYILRIMTIHQAKGLEFPVVVLGAAMNGRLPASRRSDPYEIPYSLRASGKPEVDDPHLVDERKLFYVAATRARDLLIVGTAEVVTKRGGGPSLFLTEMFGQDLRAAAAYSEEMVKDIESQPPAGGGPRPRHSFSQLAYYLQCPMRYKFAVVYGLEVPWLDPVDFGANVHRCLEAIHQRALRGKKTTTEDLPDLVAQIWISTPRSDPEQEAGYRRAATSQLTRYLEEHGERLPDTRQAETIFSHPYQDDVLLGKVDLIRAAGKDEVEIVDFKTSASTFAEMDQVALQLGMYALGVESGLSQPVASQAAHFLEDGQLVTWDWTPDQKAQAETDLKDLLNRIHSEEFPPRLVYCIHCSEFRSICPHYRDASQGGQR
jgi:DNA helicase-2/ATP-dependent DNA helicase PcrA